MDCIVTEKIMQDIREKEKKFGVHIDYDNNFSVSGSNKAYNKLELGLLTIITKDTYDCMKKENIFKNVPVSRLNIVEKINTKDWTDMQNFVIGHEIGHNQDQYNKHLLLGLFLNIPLTLYCCFKGPSFKLLGLLGGFQTILLASTILVKRYHEKQADIYSATLNKTDNGAIKYFNYSKQVNLDWVEQRKKSLWSSVWTFLNIDKSGYYRFDIIHPHPNTRINYLAKCFDGKD